MDISTAVPSISLRYDNNTAIINALDWYTHDYMKHVAVRYHYTCDAVKDRKISLSYIVLVDSIVDILTKPLLQDVYEKHIVSIGLMTR